MNKFSKIITQNKKNGASQSMLYALGLTKQDLMKPQVGIGTVWFESNPCNAKLNILSQKVKDSLSKKDLLPFRFNTIGISDGISMGTDGMKYSLPSRELITDSMESIVRGQHYDSLVCIPGCDKNLPASAMALARLNRPGFIIYGGSMKPSYHQDMKLDIVSSFESYGKYLKNEISDETRQEIVEKSCHQDCGACSGFYTANTMACILEVMGLMLPNGSSNMSLSKEKFDEIDNAGDVMLNLMEKDIKPLEIMTKESFLNAIKFLTLIGGSTNGVIHLLAIAKTANVDIKLSDFNVDLPVITNMKPHGINVMNDLSNIGGTASLIKFLIKENVLNGDCLTITGKSLWENVEDYQNLRFDQNVIMPLIEPFKSKSHINILFGNMAPDGCVSKIYSEKKEFVGKAIVFDSEEEMLIALENGRIKEDNFIILRYQGESIGCPEMLTPTSALVGYFNSKGKGDKIPPFATDGRFSGGSTGILVAHLPDAYKNTITSVIKNDDDIRIDLLNNKIELLVPESEIKIRKSNIPKLELNGYLKKYNKLVTNLDSGYLT
jgi:dihydroxy-acid dehydratase